MHRQDEQLVGVVGMARLLGCSPQTVRNLERRGELPTASRVEETRIRVWKLADVAPVVAARTSRSVTEKVA